MMTPCYNVLGKPNDEDEPRAINIPESNISRNIAVPKASGKKFKQPLKLKKVNIGTTKDPKFSNIGYYWDDLTMGKVTNFIH